MKNIAIIPATPDYIALMERLVKSPRPPPLTEWQKWRRSINKKLGRPATPDVGILAGMFISLRDATSVRVGTAIDRVAVSHPPIPGLSIYDIHDALEYANLRPWLTFDLPRARPVRPGTSEGTYPWDLTEGHAVFAAHKEGLCKSYKDPLECLREEEQMKRYTVMVTGLTPGDFRYEVVNLRTPFAYYQDHKVLDWAAFLGLGLDAMDAFKSPDAYWKVIQDQLIAQLRASEIDMIMLTGENATHPDFRQAIRKAVEGIRHNLWVTKYGVGYGHRFRAVWLVDSEGDQVNPAFAAARGAAQYARWRQEAPVGCREFQSCDEERARERDRERDRAAREDDIVDL